MRTTITPIFFSSLRSSFSITFNNHRHFSPSSSSPNSVSITTMSAPSSMSVVSDNLAGIANRLWLKFRKESITALYTPFLVSLASGNLTLDTFRQFVAQEIHFLKAFAQAYKLAEDYADDDDKITINHLRKSVLEELKLHDYFVKRLPSFNLLTFLTISVVSYWKRPIEQEWGADLVKEKTLNSATVKYTDFLLATASGKIEGVKGPGKLATPFEKTIVAAYTLGAMTPCMRLYAFIGKELQSLLDTSESNHPYIKWIQNYSSPNFEAAAVKTEDLLDKLSVSLTGEELGVIEKLYHQAMKLEIDFFSAQPLVQKTVVPLSKVHNPDDQRLVIFSDFDLTCTVVDSSAILAEIAIVTAPKYDQNHTENQLVRMSSADLKNTWDVLSRQYTEEYEQCIESILHAKNAEKFDYEGLSKALEKLSDFEGRANTRVIESGVLKGLDLEDIKRAGEHLLFQDGCTGFFKRIINNEKLNAKVHILSYCWCADLIRSAFSAGGLSFLNVHANEFTYNQSKSTGEIIKEVESPIDKVQAFKNILQKENEENKNKNITVYIGDSVGDLLCLLEADVGIVLGSSLSLRRLGTHFGVSFVPLFPGVIKKQKECIEEAISSSCNWMGLSGVVYTVSSWAEIHAFILGP